MKAILIVEDETIMRESLRDWLTEGGYQVETAEEGEAALKTITEQDFGIVILDLKLPGKNGIEVLREAKTKRPEIKGIIITAYPSVQTAVEAMKEGAIDYLPKPFDLNTLEKLIEETLGPVQLEIKAKAPPAEPKEKAVAPQEIPVHLKQGREHFAAGRYTEALKEFQTVLAIAPGNIETRVWLRKTNQKLTEGGTEAVAEEAKPKYCVWMSLGLVSYRVCTHNMDCLACEFDQSMQEKMASGGTPEIDAVLERLKELPGSQRLCRYALKGEVSSRLCTRLFQCVACEFGQMMEEVTQQKLVKLAARRDALRRKEQKAQSN